MVWSIKTENHGIIRTINLSHQLGIRLRLTI